MKNRRQAPLPRAVTLAWLRYFAGRCLQMVGLLLVTAAGALFFGADAERRMLVFTAAGGLVFLLGRLLARKRPPTAP